ncbi:MAG: hypothetical protein ACFE75_12785 [Candidatus Hodarchaeota archaeon]
MKLRNYGILWVAILSLVIFGSTLNVVASDDDGDGVDDDYEELNKRNIEVEIYPGQIEIESKLRQGSQIDEIELEVKYGSGGLEIGISYESEYTSENETEFEIEFEAAFRKLIEFVDLNGNGIYDPSIDNTIQEINLDSFQPAIYTSSNISDDTTLHYILINTTDGVFAAHVYLVEEFSLVNGTLIRPTSLKVDIEITNFNYLDLGSQLALYIKLESSSEYETEDNTEDEKDGYITDESGVKTIINDYKGVFTWKENATIDGVSKRVLSSAIEVDDDDENEQKLYLNYPRGDHIYHDPAMSIYSVASGFDWLPILIIGSIIGIVSVLSVLSIVIFRKRKNRK